MPLSKTDQAAIDRILQVKKMNPVSAELLTSARSLEHALIAKYDTDARCNRALIRFNAAYAKHTSDK